MAQVQKPPFSGHELSRKSAVEVVKLLRNRDILPQELITICAGRIAATDADVNAMPVVCEERARRANVEGDPDHPAWLAGMPVGIKDLSAVAGVRTTYGTKGYADNVPDFSDPIVRRVEARGAIVIGKTNTPEFGAGANTFNAVFGPTRNPWNTAMNAGGSSGGAAASLATGQTWLSHGSDHAGSLRTPAALCGVVGLRPSPGLVPGSGALGFNREGMQGPMARNVTDCAFFLDAMTGLDPYTPGSFDVSPGSFSKAVQQAAPPLRISFNATLGGYAPVAKDLERVMTQALDRVVTSGASVDDACPKMGLLERTYRILRGQSWAAGLGNAGHDILDHIKPVLRENLAFGQSLTIDDVSQAERDRAELHTTLVTHFETFDVIACPVVGCPAGPVEEEFPQTVASETMDDYISWLKFAFLATTLGLPAMSIPIAIHNGMPVGLQLIGPPRGEAKLLQAAKFIEDVMALDLTPIDPQASRPS